MSHLSPVPMPVACRLTDGYLHVTASKRQRCLLESLLPVLLCVNFISFLNCTSVRNVFSAAFTIIIMPRSVSRSCFVILLHVAELSRRDDLESLGYCFVYWLAGGLPWQGLKVASRSKKYEHILDMKASMAPEALCRGLPGAWRGCLLD